MLTPAAQTTPYLGRFHYIDWNITNRASLGFFNALIAAEADDQGNRHGFDVNYINPILFLRSLAPSGAIPDHTLAGFNAKYKVLDKTTVYGQLMFDQSASTNTSPRNAFQLGFRGADLLKVNSLNYLFEFNTATPYTYSNQYPIVNYVNLTSQWHILLALILKRVLGIMTIPLANLIFRAQLNYAKYGLNTATVNYGKDITLADNALLPPANGGTGQGISTTLKYAEGTVAYMLNPKYNLRVEVGGILRQEKQRAYQYQKRLCLLWAYETTFRNFTMIFKLNKNIPLSRGRARL